ncbi:MAG: preprotein translocase subunit SecE [Flavobacteriales bacterium]|jgi:preprotein translocase subunit SecE|nr:MAG: preprotein translocase subunit SecE [Flavobacteriales bacterium]|tara:strand:+ start:1734 stop:1928 length:195 start_codon:yes stop_codon:yes gene_type:complete
MMTIISYIKDSFSELKNHVTWTPQSELLRHTTVVVVFSIIFSLAIWGADSVLSRVVKFYFQLIS